MTFFRHSKIEIILCIEDAVLSKGKLFWTLVFYWITFGITYKAFGILRNKKHWSKEFVDPYLTEIVVISGPVLYGLSYGILII